jgi:hypothetical protein
MKEVQPRQIAPCSSAKEALLSDVFAAKLDGQARSGGLLSEPERSPQACRRRRQMHAGRGNTVHPHIPRKTLQSPIIARGERGRIA